jgi:hypothetical protein
VIFWMAGLFLFPRYLIHHQEALGTPEAAAWARREGMLRRMILTPSLLIVWVLGLALSANIGLFDGQTGIGWLHSKGYTPDKADIYLPHDGATNDRVIDVSFESAFRAAGYNVTVIANQGKGAARMRIEAGRRVFPAVWFDEGTTTGGVEALGWYHEKKSEDDREIGLGPNHDWSSHCADAFGMMAIAYEMPKDKTEPAPYRPSYQGKASWMR